MIGVKSIVMSADRRLVTNKFIPFSQFVVGEDDDFIPPHHSEELIASFQSTVRTNLFMVAGGHNDSRPVLVFEAVSQFLRTHLSLHESEMLEVPSIIRPVLHQNPPWAYARMGKSVFRALQPNRARRVVGAETQEGEELGMTKERQDDIQNKLHLMLGQG